MSSVWETRWQTLETLLNALARQYQHAAQEDPWMQTMHGLILCLKAFGQSQFYLYYNDLFQNQPQCPVLVQPKEHLMHAMLEQITHDMALFQKAIGQRRQANLRPSLCKADQLAQHAFNQAANVETVKEKQVVTYFDPSAAMRILTYAPIILIAMPSETINTAVFWQMLLHLECPQNNVHYYWPDCACTAYCLS
jgi:hypothetical protein